jgi:hypothetical protein
MIENWLNQHFIQEFRESLPRMEPVRDSFESDGGGTSLEFPRDLKSARDTASEALAGTDRNFTSRLDASAPSFRGLRSGLQEPTPIKAERSRRLWFAGADGSRLAWRTRRAPSERLRASALRR